jgi:hypothetical protein
VRVVIVPVAGGITAPMVDVRVALGRGVTAVVGPALLAEAVAPLVVG